MARINCDLLFDGLAGVLVVARAVAGDEEGRFERFGGARKGELFDDAARPRQKHLRHAGVGPDRPAVIEGLAPMQARAGKTGAVLRGESQFPRDDLVGEVAFADKQGHDENAGGEHAAQNLPDVRLLLPKGLLHRCQDIAAAQLIGVLVNRRGRIRVDGRSVSGQHQRVL